MKNKPVISRYGLSFIWRQNAFRDCAEAVNIRTVHLSCPNSGKQYFFENAVLGPPVGKDSGRLCRLTSGEMRDKGYVGVYSFVAKAPG